MSTTDKARRLVEARRQRALRELERIRDELEQYAPQGAGEGADFVHYGHAGDLAAVLRGLDNLHLVGAAYKRECGNPARDNSSATQLGAPAPARRRGS